MSFHVDLLLVSSGLQNIVDENQPITFGLVDDDEQGSTRLGVDCLLQGIGWTVDEFLVLFRLVAEHVSFAPDRFHLVFADVLNKKGIKLEDVAPAKSTAQRNIMLVGILIIAAVALLILLFFAVF